MKSKKHRLEKNIYCEKYPVVFTLCTKDKFNYFESEEVVKESLLILKDIVKRYDVINWIYVFMPDHIHLILQNKNGGTNLLDAISLLKQKMAYYLRRSFLDFKWQKSFYDHVIRMDEDIEKHIKYAAGNPVRKGFVKKWEDYKWTGSLSFKPEDIIS